MRLKTETERERNTVIGVVLALLLLLYQSIKQASNVAILDLPATWLMRGPRESRLALVREGVGRVRLPPDQGRT